MVFVAGEADDEGVLVYWCGLVNGGFVWGVDREVGGKWKGGGIEGGLTV